MKLKIRTINDSGLNIGELISLWLLDGEEPIDLLPIDSIVPSSSGLSSVTTGTCKVIGGSYAECTPCTMGPILDP